MASFEKKIGMIAALALALTPGSSLLSVRGHAQTPKTPPPPPGEVKKILDRAEQMRTEGGRHAATVEAAQADAEKDKKAAASKGAAASAPTGATGNKAPMPPVFAVQRDKGDPFAVPIKPQANVIPQSRPQGQSGLLVSEAELQGLIKGANPSNNVAIVRAPSGTTYFLKANDKLYNARVTRVTADAVYFEETVVDSLGKTTKNEVVKRLASAPPPPKQ